MPFAPALNDANETEVENGIDSDALMMHATALEDGIDDASTTEHMGNFARWRTSSHSV